MRSLSGQVILTSSHHPALLQDQHVSLSSLALSSMAFSSLAPSVPAPSHPSPSESESAIVSLAVPTKSSKQSEEGIQGEVSDVIAASEELEQDKMETLVEDEEWDKE